jgi:hypothetical protein
MEIFWGTDDRGPMIWRYADSDHVPLKILTEMNTGIEAPRHHGLEWIVNGNVQNDVWVLPRKEG